MEISVKPGELLAGPVPPIDPRDMQLIDYSENPAMNGAGSRILPSAAGCLIFWLACDPQAILAQQPPAPVVVAKVESSEIGATAPFIATFRPSQRAVIGSAVAGRVENCLVSEGDRVQKDQELVQILTKTINLELKAAEATLDLRRSELEELQSGLRPGEVEQAKAKMLSAKAAADLARIQLDRMEELRQSRAVPRNELDTAEATYEQRRQEYLDLKAAFELAEEGTRAEKIVQAQAQFDFQQAEVDRIKDQISKYTIRTRFDGYVVTQHVDDGAWVVVGAPVMEVVALDQVELVAAVNDQYVRYIRPGATVDISVSALPEEPFRGEVLAVVPQADLQARTFPVIIRVENRFNASGPLIKSGMVARVDLPTAEPQQALLVPKDALVLGGASKIVYVVSEQPTEKGGERRTIAKPVAVQTGIAKNNWIQVQGDLKAGELVVIEGNERLRKDQPVAVVETRPAKNFGALPNAESEPPANPTPEPNRSPANNQKAKSESN